MVFARCMSIVTLAAAPFAAVAQDRTPRPDPLAPAGTVSQPAYESVFRSYRTMPALPEAGAGWQDANSEVGALGGHAGHARQAKPVDSAAAGDPGALSSPAPSGHDQHGMHHGARGKS